MERIKQKIKKHKKLLIAILLVILFFLPIIPKIPNTQNDTAFRVEWLTDEEKAQRGDTSYGYERIVSRFNETWIGLYQPLSFVPIFGCNWVYTVVKVGIFSDHEFIDEVRVSSYEPECYGLKIKELENTGWMWKRQVYYKCYGIEIAQNNACVY